MNEHSEKIRKSARINNTYTLTAWGVTALLTALALVCRNALSSYGYEVRSWPPVFTLVLIWLIAREIAHKIARWVCRKCGLSLERTDIDIISRTPLAKNQQKAIWGEESAQEPSLVPVQGNRGPEQFIIPVCLAGLAGCFSVSLVKSLSLPDALLKTCLIGVAGVTAIRSWRNRKEPRVQADENGLRCCDELGWSVSEVKWEMIDSVVFATHYGVRGEIKNRSLRVRDASGHTLFLVAADATQDSYEALYQIKNYARIKLTGAPHRQRFCDAPMQKGIHLTRL